MTAKRRHGTHAGWAMHQRAGETPCDPCWQAKSDYDKRRLGVPENTLKNRERAKAQNRARSALVRAHQDEYRALYEAELRKAGLL